MSDPDRLLDGDATEHERMLLRAGASEEPPRDGSARLAAALGLPVLPHLPGAFDASMPHGPAPLPPALPSAGPLAGAAAKGLGSKLALKTLALVVSGGLAITGAVTLTQPRAPEVAPRVQTVQTVERVHTSIPEPAVPARAEPVPAPSSARPENSSERGARSQRVRDEVERLDRVRALLHHDDSAGALAELRDYDRTHRRGAMREEALLLRIEALAKSGEQHKARRAAAQFVRRHPNSVHAARLSTWLSEDAR